MARTSPKYESVIDGLDCAMVFAFALRGEMGRGPDLMRLRELAKETREAVTMHPLGLLELAKPQPLGFAVGLVSSVMNGLRAAVANNMVPELPDLGLEWVDLPPILSASDLESTHTNGFEDIAKVSTTILQQVDLGFPAEAKPFISVAQFDAVSRGVLARTPTKSNVPIHVPSLVRLLHTNFLASIAADRSSFLRHENLVQLVRKYCAKAEQEHLAVVKQTFVIRTIQRLYPKAVDISIPLDAHYSWGCLCALFPSAREWLRLYASLNRSQAVDDSKFRPKDDIETSEPLSADNFINLCAAMMPRPLPKGRSQIYFDTDRSSIEIHGKSIQKHGVMAISYAAPLTEIEEVITRFGVFLLNTRRSYCHATRGTFTNEEADALNRIGSKADELREGDRVLLHDKSSVLANLCALMDLEMQQDHEFASLSSKAQVLTISDWLTNAGFKYSIESIRKSCESRNVMLDRVQKYLSGL